MLICNKAPALFVSASVTLRNQFVFFCVVICRGLWNAPTLHTAAVERLCAERWEYFQGADLKYAHIAIDEIHNFVSPSSSEAYVEKWDQFLGEVRHRGCTFEGLTQDIAQVDQVFVGRAAVRMELIPAEDFRDPYFKGASIYLRDKN